LVKKKTRGRNGEAKSQNALYVNQMHIGI
jgi:hypothetical protein